MQRRVVERRFRCVAAVLPMLGASLAACIDSREFQIPQPNIPIGGSALVVLTYPDRDEAVVVPMDQDGGLEGVPFVVRRGEAVELHILHYPCALGDLGVVGNAATLNAMEAVVDRVGGGRQRYLPGPTKITALRDGEFSRLMVPSEVLTEVRFREEGQVVFGADLQRSDLLPPRRTRPSDGDKICGDLPVFAFPGIGRDVVVGYASQSTRNLLEFTVSRFFSTSATSVEFEVSSNLSVDIENWINRDTVDPRLENDCPPEDGGFLGEDSVVLVAKGGKPIATNTGTSTGNPLALRTFLWPLTSSSIRFGKSFGSELPMPESRLRVSNRRDDAGREMLSFAIATGMANDPVPKSLMVGQQRSQPSKQVSDDARETVFSNGALQDFDPSRDFDLVVRGDGGLDVALRESGPSSLYAWAPDQAAPTKRPAAPPFGSPVRLTELFDGRLAVATDQPANSASGDDGIATLYVEQPDHPENPWTVSSTFAYVVDADEVTLEMVAVNRSLFITHPDSRDGQGLVQEVEFESSEECARKGCLVWDSTSNRPKTFQVADAPIQSMRAIPNGFVAVAKDSQEMWSVWVNRLKQPPSCDGGPDMRTWQPPPVP